MAGLVQLQASVSKAAPGVSPVAAPLGLYVHVPFCVRKCHYCDFASGPAPEAIRREFVDVLVEEIRRSPWRGQPARTVFFGGGTPSELSSEHLARVAAALRESFVFPGGVERAEWTIECNPGTVTLDSLAAMRAMGFNRVSLGVQSFHDHHLKALGRIHTAAEAEEALRLVRETGFRRLNLDLIFCLPGQSLAEWKEDLERALALKPEHLSLYNLTIEPETEFGRRYRLGRLDLPDEDLSADMYEWALRQTAAAGLERYEVSNFARPGEECLHNQIYWRQEPFLGFGLGAASYMDGTRWCATRSMQRYLRTALRPEGAERDYTERLPPEGACGEAIMLGLRTREGIDLERTAARHGLDAEARYGSLVRRLEAYGLLRWESGRWKLTDRGFLLANAVCAEFLP